MVLPPEVVANGWPYFRRAVLAELNSNRATVRPRAFADDQLDIAHRQPFGDKVRDAGVPSSFAKDVSLIKAKLHRTRLDFDDDLSVMLPAEALDGRVKLTDTSDGRMKLELEGRLKTVRGAR